MDIQIDQGRLKAIRKEAEEEYYKQYKRALFDEIAQGFQKKVTIEDGKVYRHEGPMRELLKKQTEDFYLDAKTQDRAVKYIDEAFNVAMQNCIDDAIAHAIRKNNFEQLVKAAKHYNEKILSS